MRLAVCPHGKREKAEHQDGSKVFESHRPPAGGNPHSTPASRRRSDESQRLPRLPSSKQKLLAIAQRVQLEAVERVALWRLHPDHVGNEIGEQRRRGRNAAQPAGGTPALPVESRRCAARGNGEPEQHAGAATLRRLDLDDSADRGNCRPREGEPEPVPAFLVTGGEARLEAARHRVG